MGLSSFDPLDQRLLGLVGNDRRAIRLVHVTARYVAFIGDENASCAPALPLTERSSDMERRTFKKLLPFINRSSKEATQRHDAENTTLVPDAVSTGIAGEADVDAQIVKWVSSPGLQPPK